MTSVLYTLAHQKRHMLHNILDAETPEEEGERKDLERITDIIRKVLGTDKFIDPHAVLKDDLGVTNEQYKEIIEKVASEYNMPATEDVPFDDATAQAIYEWTKEKRNTNDAEETKEKKEESTEGITPRRRRFFRSL